MHSVEEPLLQADWSGPIDEPVSWLPFWMRQSKPAQKRRLVDRGANFGQSKGAFFIRKRIKMKDRRALYAGDWFHSLVNSPTYRLILTLLTAYMSLTVLFAIPYYAISKFYSCNMGIDNFREAFVFSLETMATIGYGTQDIFFDDCIAPVVVLAVQICVKLVADALTIGILYSRVARPNTRASTILFAKEAVIRRIRGRLYLMFQICELRKHQLVEAHVRLYLVRHDRGPEVGGETSYFQTCTMRLNHPNDELGGMLLLCLPQIVVHEIDLWSPLYPPPVWASEKEAFQWTPPAHVDLMDSDRDVEEVCGPCKHQRGASPTRGGYQALDEADLLGTEVFPAAKRTYGDSSLSPYAGRFSRSYAAPTPPLDDPLAAEARMIQEYMRDRRVEVVAIVEGTDAATGGSVQARHSYIAEEVLWDRSYSRCVFEGDDGAAIIDFSKFHDTVPCAADAHFSGVMPSQV
jgi:hypothetical protein